MTEEEKEYIDKSINIIRNYYYNNIWKQAMLDTRISIYKKDDEFVIKFYDDAKSSIPSFYYFDSIIEAINNYVYLISSTQDDYVNIMNLLENDRLNVIKGGI